MRLIALVCIVLALFVAGLEATHSHSDAAVARTQLLVSFACPFMPMLQR